MSYPSREKIYSLTGDEYGALNIFSYDLAQAKESRILTLKPGGVASKMIPPVICWATNSSKQRFDYYYVPPADLNVDKRYPVFIDMTSCSRNDHGIDVQFLANAGIYYVSPNSYGITTWGVVPKPGNTLYVYRELLKNPNIDTNRIYISGKSVTTTMACQMVNDNPDLWRGLILSEPLDYPDLKKINPATSVFVTVGDSDSLNEFEGSSGRAEKFFLAAAANFSPARLDYQPGPHVFQPQQLKDSYKAIARYILSDY